MAVKYRHLIIGKLPEYFYPAGGNSGRILPNAGLFIQPLAQSGITAVSHYVVR
jgi:hypothetical protein